MNKVLIVDDEKSILDIISLTLKYENYIIETCLNGFSALEKIKNDNFDLVLLDIKMPKMDGLEVLEKIKEYNEDIVVIMISGHGNIETAVEATKKGAYNFIEKPPDLHELKLTIKNALEYKNSKDELKKLRNELIEANNIIGTSRQIQNIKELILKFAAADSNVLISGESGTGKYLVAKQIHLNSARAESPFVNINCASLTESNIDPELFGVFENNKEFKKGKLLEADNGIILFDEVSNLSLEVQSKILKVIEENKFSVAGHNEDFQIKVRFLFSTNKDILNEISENRFREDLYHRMNVLLINIPPLRERREDISDLVNIYCENICRSYNIKPKRFSKEAMNFLMSFRWPGNVRELRNLVERMIFSVDSNLIEVDDIEIPETKHTKFLNELINKDLSLNDFQNESEKIFIMKMLNDYKYNISQTAEALNIQRSHLYKLMSKYNIPLPSKIKP
jgi:DNA-binding NtrC family response regulator